MADTERLYDEQIAPLLRQISAKCEAAGLPFVAAVEFKPGEVGETRFLPSSACLSMRMTSLAAGCYGNFDALALALLRHCQANNIDTSASIFLRLGAPTKDTQ